MFASWSLKTDPPKKNVIRSQRIIFRPTFYDNFVVGDQFILRLHQANIDYMNSKKCTMIKIRPIHIYSCSSDSTLKEFLPLWCFGWWSIIILVFMVLEVFKLHALTRFNIQKYSLINVLSEYTKKFTNMPNFLNLNCLTNPRN